MKRLRNLLLVIAASLLLTAGTVLLIIFDPSYVLQDAAGKTISLIILPLWAFSAVPAYVFEFEWLKDKPFMTGFWVGYFFGLFYPLLIAPVLMVFYYVGAIENLVKKK